MCKKCRFVRIQLVFIVLLLVLTSCKSGQGSPATQQISSNVTPTDVVTIPVTPSATSTSTPAPTKTQRPTITPSITPIPTAGLDFIAKAGAICDSSKSNKVTRGTPPKAVFSILKMRDAWYRNSYFVPFAEVNLADQVKTLVCIDENYTKVGTYDDGNPAYRVNQDVRLVNYLTGEIYQQKSFHGGNPPQIKLSAIPAGYGENPDKMLVLNWILVQLDLRFYTHDSSVTSIEFSPDGSKLAVNSFQNEVKVWNLKTDKAVTLVKGQESFGSDAKVSYSPDGAILAYLDSEFIKYKDSTGKAKVPETFYDFVIDISPDGKEIAVGGILYDGDIPDGRLVIYDLFTGESRLQMVRQRMDTSQEKGYKFTDLVYSPDGKHIATNGPGLVDVFSTADGKREYTFKSNSKFLNKAASINRGVAFSADSRWLAYGTFPQGITIVDTQTWQEVAKLPGHDGETLSLAFSPKDRILASGGADNQVILWDTQTWQQKQVLSGHTGMVYTLAFSPDGNTLASGSQDTTVYFWDMAEYLR